MFGLVAQVSLSDRQSMANPVVFRFAENEQHGDKANTARIVFHTTHRWDTNAIKTAQVDLYNLNDETWNWIQKHGGNWSNGNLSSNLYLKLQVGWSNFGKPSPLYTIFEGNVNSFFPERDGRDNIFHFFCGMMPKMDARTPMKPIPRTPQSAIELPWGNRREDIIKDLFLDVLSETGFAADHLGLNYTPTNEALKTMHQTGQFQIKIEFPLIDNFGEETKVDDAAAREWLNGRIAKSIIGSGNSIQTLQRFCQAEGAVMGDYRFEGVYHTSATSGQSEVIQPTFILRLRRGNRKMSRPTDLVPPQNVIVNYEMLTQDPRPTDMGVQIHSLMRPWIEVESRIKLAIITDAKQLRANQVGNINYARPELAYTASMSSQSNYYMSVWGNKSAVFDTTLEALKQKQRTTSFLNIPLMVFEVQHIGDTHGTKWHSLITTYAPGVSFGA